MKKTILFITVFLLFISCTEDKPCSCFNIDAHINLFLKDSQGANLLNTTNYNSANYKIYYELNGQKIEVNNPLSGYPRGFLIDYENNTIYMRLFLNIDENETMPVTYIEWNNTDTDTLRVSVLRTENSIVWDKLWVNDELVYQPGTPNGTTGREITIVK
jgi:hypothetical protein